MHRREIAGWIGVYAFWVVSVAIGIGLYLVSRQTIGIVAEVAGADELVRTAIDRFYLFFTAIALIVVIVFVEHYYRTGLRKGRLLVRVARVVGIELLVLTALHTIPQVVVGGYGSWIERVVILIEGAGGFALLGVSLRRRQKERACRR